jgi:hypothetical protein
MSRRTAMNLLLSAAGLALLVWQVRWVGGLGAIGQGLASVGFGLVPIVGLALVRFGALALAWLALLPVKAPFRSALAASISGDAIGNLTPLGLAASEPAKAVYLGRHVDRTMALAALTAENFFYTVSIALYIVAGTGALLLAFEVNDSLRLAGLSALALMAALLAAAGWVAWQRPAAVSALLTRIPSDHLRSIIIQVRAFEVQTYGSVTHESTRVGALVVSEIAFHAFSLAECWLTLRLLTGRSLVLEALILDSLGRIINIVFKIIPLRLGVDEVSARAVATAIGVGGSNGLVLALVRKIRMLIFAAVGLAILGRRARSAPAS